MAEAAARRGGALVPRILSALVMIPAALAAAWFGPPWVTLLVALAGLAMGWEWGRLAAGQAGPRLALVIATILAADAAAGVGAFPLAAALAAAGAAAAALIQAGRRYWTAGGTLWIALGCVAFLWLGTPQAGGRGTLVWLLAVVWASDIFAFGVGKLAGGPRLAPHLSPNKTWSGLAGGLAGAVGAGIAAAPLLPLSATIAAAAGLILGLAAQGGDLAESWAKRRFAVKDTSGLIPGHGGALDRLDGLLAASLAAALLTILFGKAALQIR